MKIKQIILSLVFIFVGVSFVATPSVYAAECAGVKTSIIGGDICNGVNPNSTDGKDSAVWKLLILVMNILTAGIGIAGVGGIAYGSLLYTTAGDKAEQTKKAIEIITNVVIGIVAYALMYLFLNYLIPGGLFS
jgi:hypothetical protein